jgi:hypothetical protein
VWHERWAAVIDPPHSVSVPTDALVETLLGKATRVAPVEQLEALQEALWRHAVFGSRTNSSIGDLVARFELSACGGAGDEATADTIVRLRPDGTPKRKYRRSEKSKGPRLYRTRKDRHLGLPTVSCQSPEHTLFVY